MLSQEEVDVDQGKEDHILIEWRVKSNTRRTQIGGTLGIILVVGKLHFSLLLFIFAQHEIRFLILTFDFCFSQVDFLKLDHLGH